MWTPHAEVDCINTQVDYTLCSHPKPTPLAFPTPLFLGKCHQWNGAACATYFRSSSNWSKHLLLQAPFNSFSIQMNHSKQLLTTFQFDQLKFSLNQLRFISSLIPDVYSLGAILGSHISCLKAILLTTGTTTEYSNNIWREDSTNILSTDLQSY